MTPLQATFTCTADITSVTILTEGELTVRRVSIRVVSDNFSYSFVLTLRS